MSSPYMIAAIGFTSIAALAAIVATASTVMDNSLMTQEAMRIQTQKHQEALELTILDDVLNIRNVGMNPVVIKEIRVLGAADNAPLSKKAFPPPGLVIPPLGKSSHAPDEISVADFQSKTIIAITELGNTFTALDAGKITHIQAADSGKGSSMIEGMGLNSRIIQTTHQGRLVYGHGVAGAESSLKPYNTVPVSTDFAAQILDTDARTVVTIPKFNSEYRYVLGQQSLQQTGVTVPNILSYSQARTAGGTGAASQNSDGISFSGTGTIVLKLNDFGGKVLVLEGSVPAGSQLQLVEFNENNLMVIPYDNALGWQVWGSTYGSIHPASHVHSGCGAPYSVSHTMSVSPNKAVSPQHSVKRLSGGTYYNPAFTASTIDGVLKIQSISETKNVTYCDWGLLCGDSSCTWGWTEYKFPNTSPPHIPIPGTVSVFDHSPVNTVHAVFVSEYQTAYEFPAGKQMYLIAKPNGKTVTIKATALNPHTTPYLKITDLPANTPYEIIKDGFVGARGMAQSDGTVTLFLDDVSISGTDQGGVVRLYLDSTRYRGAFSTVVFDNLNRQTIHITGQDSKVYVVHAYVQIPVVGNASVSGVYLDGVLPLPYLDGSYATGDRIRVPVIPGYRIINMTINGIPTITMISDVLGGTGLKVIEHNTSTITKYDSGGLVSSISATAGSVAYIVSTTDGTITTSVTATISGSSEIENYAYFKSPPPPPPPPPPRDPLKAYVDIYKNGKFVAQQQIYFNANPSVENSGSTGGSSSVVTARYTYPQTVVNGILTTGVNAGDMVEIYLYADIYSDGPIPPVPSGYMFQNYAGRGSATATIHGGSILSS